MNHTTIQEAYQTWVKTRDALLGNQLPKRQVMDTLRKDATKQMNSDQKTTYLGCQFYQMKSTPTNDALHVAYMAWCNYVDARDNLKSGTTWEQNHRRQR